METRLAYIKVVCQWLRSILEAPRCPEGVLPLQNLHLLAHSLAERGVLVGPTMEGDPVREDVEGEGGERGMRVRMLGASNKS